MVLRKEKRRYKNYNRYLRTIFFLTTLQPIPFKKILNELHIMLPSILPMYYREGVFSPRRGKFLTKGGCCYIKKGRVLRLDQRVKGRGRKGFLEGSILSAEVVPDNKDRIEGSSED